MFCLFGASALTKIFKTALWMRKYNALSFKRTWIWSNSRRISILDLGAMTEKEKQGCVPTTVRYKDKSGRTRFKGNSFLKRSQYLVYSYTCMIAHAYFSMFSSWSILVNRFQNTSVVHAQCPCTLTGCQGNTPIDLQARFPRCGKIVLAIQSQ